MDERYARFSRLLIDRPHPRVLRVIMNRPDKLNAWRGEMEGEVRAAMKASGVTASWPHASADQTSCTPSRSASVT